MSKESETVVALSVFLVIIVVGASFLLFITLDQKRTIDEYKTKYSKLSKINKKNVRAYDELQNTTKRIMKIANNYKEALTECQNNKGVCTIQLANQRKEYQELLTYCKKLAEETKEQKTSKNTIDTVMKLIQLISLFG
ncbi:hypothetical protein DRJ25_01395 [Candidatus Woesearchaeota archaeon]|nr:MAG: hypothetical protein DRJ25_01395 [Candidatus Woesearchaeota archaeon]